MAYRRTRILIRYPQISDLLTFYQDDLPSIDSYKLLINIII
jgi:hypothetical protein